MSLGRQRVEAGPKQAYQLSREGTSARSIDSPPAHAVDHAENTDIQSRVRQ